MHASKLPAVKDDLFLFNGRKVSDLVIRSVIKFQGRLNQEALIEALNQLLICYPILSAKFTVRGLFRPVWRVDADINVDDIYNYLEVSTEEEQARAIDRWLVEPMGIINQLGFRVKLIRSEDDVLIIKVSHIIVDAGGVKELLGDLAKSYKELLTNRDFKLPVCDGDRSLKQVYTSFPPVQRLKILGHSVKVIKSRLWPYGNWKMSLKSGDSKKRRMIIYSLNEEKVATIKDYCKQQNVTVNDIMVACYFRALYKLIQPKAGTCLRILSTINLRRYLPDNRGANLCNLSSTLNICIGRNLGKSLAETIEKVRKSISWQKNSYLGLNSHQESALNLRVLPFPFVQTLFFIQSLFGLAIDGLKIAPVFTNFGEIGSDDLDFGEVYCRNVFATAPIAFYPVFFLALSGYKNSLTLSAGFCEENIDSKTVQTLLDNIGRELDKLSTPVITQTKEKLEVAE